MQVDRDALDHFQRLCFLRTMFASLRVLRAHGEDVQVHIAMPCLFHCLVLLCTP